MNLGLGPVIITGIGRWIRSTGGFGFPAQTGPLRGWFGENHRITLAGLPVDLVALSKSIRPLFSLMFIIFTIIWGRAACCLTTREFWGARG
jgi:hypothetical protein